MPDTPSGKPKLSKAMSGLLNGLLVIISVVITLGVAEIAVRILSPAGDRIAPTSDQYKFYAFDPKLGWANKKGVEGEFRRSEFGYPVRINRYGMRDAEPAPQPAPGVRRVAVLGDSFTWGIGVRDADRFTEVVERQMGGRVETLNFGVSGYGPVQYYLQLDEVLAFKPQLVLLTFCLGNDFADNVFWKRYGYYKPYLDQVADGAPRFKGYPLPHVGEFVSSDRPLAGWVLDHSRLARLIIGRLSQRRLLGLGAPQAGLTGLDETERDFYLPGETADKVMAAGINQQLLSAIKTKVEAAGVGFAVVIAPTKCEYGLCFKDQTGPNWLARDRLQAMLKALNIPMIDPSAAIGPDDFWKEDGHWKPAGHAKVASEVSAWLSAQARTAPAEH